MSIFTRDERQFLRPREAFDQRFAATRNTAIRVGLCVDNCLGLATKKIARTPAIAVLRKPSLHIGCDTRIQRAVVCLDDIEMPDAQNGSLQSLTR